MHHYLSISSKVCQRPLRGQPAAENLATTHAMHNFEIPTTCTHNLPKLQHTASGKRFRHTNHNRNKTNSYQTRRISETPPNTPHMQNDTKHAAFVNRIQTHHNKTIDTKHSAMGYYTLQKKRRRAHITNKKYYSIDNVKTKQT